MREYVDAYATYKLVGSVRGQMLAFRKGLAEAVGADALGLFLEDEAELLVAGLAEIDAREWRRHARYSGASLDAPLSAASQLAEWCGPARGARATGRAQASAEAAGRRAGSGRSWRRWTKASARSSSSSLPVRARARQQPRARAPARPRARAPARLRRGRGERVGSTRVPPSGFAHLPGLGSECPFTLSCVGGGDERLPTASTCFNLLKVPACALSSCSLPSDVKSLRGARPSSCW